MNLFLELKNRRDSVGLRFFLLFTLFIAVISVSFTVLFYHQQRNSLTEGLAGEGKLLARLLAHNIRLGVFAENTELLQNPVEGILEHEGTLFVSIVTAEGKLLREQAHKSVINDASRSFPLWSSRYSELKGTAEARVFEGDSFFEFWAPVMSSSALPADDSLLLGESPAATPRVIGYARIIVDKKLLGSKLDSLLATSVAMAAGFLLLGTIFTYIITRRITGPLDQLTRGIRVLEQGGAFEPVPVESSDEIGRLAAAFNHLGTTLKAREVEKAHLAEELRHAQKMEAIGTLAGGIAHDFNNILTAIIGFGTLLQRSLKDDNPYRIYVDQILSAADRAANLVKRLLIFGRKQVIAPQPTDLNEIVKGIEKLLQRLVSEDITFVTSLSQEPLVCHVDAGQFEQILMNLVTNARDAMPDGGSLTIATASDFLEEDLLGTAGTGKAGYYAILTVTDTGIGMDEETRERIFDPFFTTKEVGKGTGLGLSMVYGIVTQHEGFVTVDSEPGKGTVVRIYLPIVASQATAEQPEKKPSVQGNRETILIAEDDRDVRKLSKLILERNGYTVIEAGDGAEAVRRFLENRERIDLVLLDVVMPKKNGQAVYEEILGVRPGMKALFISGYTQDIINRKGIVDEGINFIAKPLKPEELLAKVREVLRN